MSTNFHELFCRLENISYLCTLKRKNNMGSVTVQKRPTLRALHHTTERKEMQVQPISKNRLHTVEEFVEQLEQAIQERL